MIRISPSKLEGCAYCPCYEREEMDSNAPADEGILCHKAVETEDLSALETDEQRVMVQGVLDYITLLKANHGPDVVVYKEVRLPAVNKSNLPAGVVDFVVASSKRVDLGDAKFGRVLVTSAEDNRQLKTYVAKLFVQWIPRFAPGVKEIHGHLVSPRLNEISTAVFKRDVIDEMKKEIRRIEHSVMVAFKVPDPSKPDLCAQCANIATCPAITQAVAKVIPMLGLPVPDAFKPGAIVSDADRSIAEQVADVLGNWRTVVKRNNRAYALDGGNVPLHTLVRKAGNKKLTSAAEAILRLIEKGYLPNIESALPALTTTVKKLVDVIASGPDHDEQYDKIVGDLSDLITQGPEITYLTKSKKKADKALLLPDPFKELAKGEDDRTHRQLGPGNESVPEEQPGAQAATSEAKPADQFSALQGISLGAGREADA